MTWRVLFQVMVACTVVSLLLATGMAIPRPEEFWNYLVSALIFSWSIGLATLSLKVVLECCIPPMHGFRRWAFHSFATLLGTVIGSEIALWIHATFLPHRPQPHDHLAMFMADVVIALIVSTTISAYILMEKKAKEAAEKLRRGEIEQERLLRLKTQAELDALRAKVDPHFLFNTLNSIASLISERPAAAEEMVERLSALFRYTLRHGNGSGVTLGEEMEIVRSYLAIEKIRLGDRLQFTITCDAEASAIRVPALLVQPLVENSIKYAIAPTVQGGWIQVEARRTPDACVITVTDSGEGFALPASSTGFGISGIRERLALAYGDRASVASADGGTSSVRITLPLEGMPA